MLTTLADGMGVDLGFRTAAEARTEMTALGGWDGQRPPAPDVAPQSGATPGPGEAVLAGWRMLLDDGRLQDGEPYLAGTARLPLARLSPATAAAIDATDTVTVFTDRGSLTLPLMRTAMPDQVVWLPLNSGTAVHSRLGVTAGAVVRIEPGGRR